MKKVFADCIDHRIYSHAGRVTFIAHESTTLPVDDVVYQLELSPDGTMLAAALGEGKFIVWDTLAGQNFADSKLMFDLLQGYTVKELVRKKD